MPARIRRPSEGFTPPGYARITCDLSPVPCNSRVIHTAFTRFKNLYDPLRLCDLITLNQRVQGSSPCAPTNKIKLLR
jgi:hypothetical protein